MDYAAMEPSVFIRLTINKMLSFLSIHVRGIIGIRCKSFSIWLNFATDQFFKLIIQRSSDVITHNVWYTLITTCFFFSFFYRCRVEIRESYPLILPMGKINLFKTNLRQSWSIIDDKAYKKHVFNTHVYNLMFRG